jgi:hypothetical protein
MDKNKNYVKNIHFIKYTMKYLYLKIDIYKIFINTIDFFFFLIIIIIYFRTVETNIIARVLNYS